MGKATLSLSLSSLSEQRMANNGWWHCYLLSRAWYWALHTVDTTVHTKIGVVDIPTWGVGAKMKWAEAQRGITWCVGCVVRRPVCTEESRGRLPSSETTAISALRISQEEPNRSDRASSLYLGCHLRRSLLINGQFLTTFILWLATILIRSAKFRGRRSGDTLLRCGLRTARKVTARKGPSESSVRKSADESRERSSWWYRVTWRGREGNVCDILQTFIGKGWKDFWHFKENKTYL